MFRRAISGFVPARFRQKLLYFRVHGRWPNLRNPRLFTEKVFWRKFHERNARHVTCSDKFLVRQYVKERVGAEVLVPLIFQTADPEELRYLPMWSNSVVKANHGWKMMEIIGEEEPSDGEKERVIGEAYRWLATSHAGLNGEAHYAGIEPRILVEQFVGDRQSDPLDCKVHCFRQRDGGVRMVVQLVADRRMSKSMTYYADGLEPRHIVREIGERPPRLTSAQNQLVDEALRNSETLSSEFDYVRVDWMLTADRIFFSELTFTPGAGLSPSMGPELDRELGRLWLQQV